MIRDRISNQIARPSYFDSFSAYDDESNYIYLYIYEKSLYGTYIRVIISILSYLIYGIGLLRHLLHRVFNFNIQEKFGVELLFLVNRDLAFTFAVKT